MSILDLLPDTGASGGENPVGAGGDLGGGNTVVGIHGAEYSPAAFSGDVNNWDLGDNADALTWLVDFAGHTLTGILAPEVTGEVHVIKAVTAGTIANASASSTAANRIAVPGGANLALTAGDTVVLEYLATTSRWQVIAYSLASGTGGPGSSSFGWFNLKAYGGVDDDSTDNLTPLTNWINAFNAAGGGVLYAPKPLSAYKTSAQPPVITGGGLMLGDGPGAFDSNSGGSMFHITSGTGTIFEFTPANNGPLIVRGIATANTLAGTPTAGSGFKVTPVTGLERVDFVECSARGFKINYDLQGTGCRRINCKSYGWVDYSAWWHNEVVADAGDCRDLFNDDWASKHDSLGMILWTSGGGLGIYGSKGNTCLDGHKANHYLVLDVQQTTSDLVFAPGSVENITGDLLHGTTASGKTFGHIQIHPQQFVNVANTGYAINLVATNAGEFYDIEILPGGSLVTSGTARTAMQFTKCDQLTVHRQQLTGYNALFATTTCTNVVDLTGGIGAGVLVTGTPSVGDVPVATSGTGAVWSAGSGVGPAKGTPATSYGTPAAGAATTYIGTGATIAKPTAADVDFSADVTTNNVTSGHHGLAPKLDGNAAHYLDGSGTFSTPVGSAGTQQHILLADGHATPFTFNDLLQMDDGSDFMWSDS